MFSSEYGQSQQNTPRHCKAISKPLVNAEKCNYSVSQEEEIATTSKFPCTGKNKILMEFQEVNSTYFASQKKMKTFERNSAFLNCEEIPFPS